MIALSFLWHMHQPDYRHPVQGEYIMPWVRLHAVKGYTDLLAVLKRQPAARCVVNFSGILLEQLSEYAAGTANDRYAVVSQRPAESLTSEERQFVLKNFFSANINNLIKPHLRYYELLTKRNTLIELEGLAGAAQRFTDAELTDLMVWFNLAWLGFSAQRREDVFSLLAQGRDFEPAQQRQVLEIHAELVKQVLPAFRELQASGQIELTFTPHHHPILPLVIDLAGEGHQAPDDSLPDFRHEDDAVLQVTRGAEWYQHSFGCAAKGAWPAEGSVSDAALRILAGAGLQWVATDQQNIPVAARSQLAHLSPMQWEQDGSSLAIFFRDTRLADNIGFEYASWSPAVAAKHMVEMARDLGKRASQPDPVITIALDGENPWENYRDGGQGFLNSLFEMIAQDNEVSCQRPCDLCAQRSFPRIDTVSAGSWIGGNFNIWSRHPETKIAWRRLAQARRELVDVCTGPIRDQLLAAEASDWFWWYGDDFTTAEQAQFDELFRAHLIAAYNLAKRNVPVEMYTPIYSERRPELIPAVEGLIEPVLDGRITTFFEWQGAIKLTSDPSLSAMARSDEGQISELWYGFSTQALYLLLKPSESLRQALEQADQAGAAWNVIVDFKQGEEFCVRGFMQNGDLSEADPGVACARGDVFELMLDLNCTQVERGAVGYIRVELHYGTRQVASFPQTGRIPIMIVAADIAEQLWLV